MTTATATHDTKPKPGGPAKTEGSSGCAAIPELTRLRYFHGRGLSALDLRREQTFHLEKHRLHNRLLHGWGIVCGLDIGVVPEGAV